MLVQISDKEQNRIPTAEQYFQELGCETEVCNLEIGDYVFDNKVAFEYKTIADFITSINDNRVFNEAINQAENYDWHYVVIQGNDSERAKQIAISRNYRPINIHQYYGAIASINRYSTVIEVNTPYTKEALYRMYIQAKKDLSTKPIVKKYPRKNKNVCFNWLCYCNYGINAKKATAIIETLELHTLSDLQNLTKEDLISVDGIGEKNAIRILEAIKYES